MIEALWQRRTRNAILAVNPANSATPQTRAISAEIISLTSLPEEHGSEMAGWRSLNQAAFIKPGGVPFSLVG